MQTGPEHEALLERLIADPPTFGAPPGSPGHQAQPRVLTQPRGKAGPLGAVLFWVGTVPLVGLGV